MRATVKKACYLESKSQSIELLVLVRKLEAELAILKETIQPELDIIERLQTKLKAAEEEIERLVREKEAADKKLQEMFPYGLDNLDPHHEKSFNLSNEKLKARKKKKSVSGEYSDE